MPQSTLPAQPLTRRAFLGRAGSWALAAAGAPWLVRCGDTVEPATEPPELAQSASFPDGVLAGARVGGVELVAQVEGLTGAPTLGLDIARDEAFTDVVVQLAIEVGELPLDVPLHVVVEGPPLVPATAYFYRFTTQSGASPTGRFAMLREASDDSPLRLGVFSCQGYPAGFFNAHSGLAEEPNLDLVVSLGDYIYEWTDDTGPEERVDTIGESPGLAESIEEYRQKYRLYRSDANLRACQARHALVAVWDNHELAAEAPGELTPRLSLAERRANGMQAFWEAMPMSPGSDDAVLYRAVPLGALAELILLDLHSYAAPLASRGSYLGTAQLAWLLDRLQRSPARWKLIATSTVMMGLDLTEGQPVNLNQWDGYPEERRALIEAVRERGIGGVVALSGDLHTFMAGAVTTTGRSDGEVGFVEVSVGAISSHGLLDLSPDQESLARNLEELALRENEHLAYIEVLTRGYALLDISQDELRVTLRGVATVAEPSTEMRDVAVLRIPWPGTTVEVVPA